MGGQEGRKSVEEVPSRRLEYMFVLEGFCWKGRWDERNWSGFVAVVVELLQEKSSSGYLYGSGAE